MASKKAKESTVDTSITDAVVPDATKHFAQVARTALLVPMGNPHKKDCTWGLPCIFWGASGIAKSDRIRQAAASVGLQCETILPGQKQPEDFSGVPVPAGDGRISMECLLSPLRRLNAQGKGVLFVDEASCAAPATQGAMLGMVNDRVVADEKFAPGIRVLLAANPPKLSAGGWSLEPPMANRMAHFQVKCPSATDWIAWLTSEGVEHANDVTHSEGVVRAGWDVHYSHARGLFAGYMRDRQIALHGQPLSDTPQAAYNWPSPRTWAWGVRTLAAIRALGADHTLESLFLEGLVGEGCASEFLAWVAAADLPTPEQVLVRGWKPDPTRLDVVMAVLTSVATYITTLKDRDEQINLAVSAWEFISQVIDLKLGDMTIPAAQALVKAKLSTKGHNSRALQKAAKPPVLILAKTGLLDYVTQSEIG